MASELDERYAFYSNVFATLRDLRAIAREKRDASVLVIIEPAMREMDRLKMDLFEAMQIQPPGYFHDRFSKWEKAGPDGWGNVSKPPEVRYVAMDDQTIEEFTLPPMPPPRYRHDWIKGEVVQPREGRILWDGDRMRWEAIGVTGPIGNPGPTGPEDKVKPEPKEEEDQDW